MKTIIEMAREAFKFPDAMVWDAWMPSLERFATRVKAAQVDELLEGVEMPEPDTHCWDSDTESDVWSYSKDQLRETVAAAVLREREACAKVCEGRLGGAVQSNEWWGGFKSAMKQCASAIRNRSNT